jgi:Xaa-Pro aminopeptidase
MRQVARLNRKVKIHRNVGRGIVSYARETKDTHEVERIKKVRNAVIYAFNHMINTVRTMRVRKNTIMKDRKRTLRINDLKAMLRKALFDRNIVDSTGMIVAQGRDAGVPHNTGRDGEAVRLGKTIVFDIFPQEAGSGYFFDFTRTLCFGFAPKEVMSTYKIVKDAQDYAMSLLAVGKGYRAVEQSICAFFEKHGHPTFVSSPKTQRGYFHGLGHGLGLAVHESPSFNLLKSNTDKIKRGHVFTVEPGLYYPDKGYGVRLEDVVYVNPRGKIENLTRCARKLIIEM